jgi:hypothetical protein
MAGRYNTIDTHPERAAIIGALLAKTPILEISAKYGVHPQALYRYRKTVAPEKVEQAVRIAHAKEVIRQKREEAQDLDPFIETALRTEREFWEIEKMAKEGDLDPETGRVRRDLRSAVAALNGVVATNRYHAELAGRLNAPGTGGDTRVILLPMLSVPQAQPALPAATAQVEAQDVEFRALPAADSK